MGNVVSVMYGKLCSSWRRTDRAGQQGPLSLRRGCESLMMTCSRCKKRLRVPSVPCSFRGSKPGEPVGALCAFNCGPPFGGSLQETIVVPFFPGGPVCDPGAGSHSAKVYGSLRKKGSRCCSVAFIDTIAVPSVAGQAAALTCSRCFPAPDFISFVYV